MRASIFITCLVDQFFPQVGISMVNVLRRLGVEVDFSPRQTCCGQPAYNSGYHSEAQGLAERFLDIFESSEYVVAPSGSCASMVKIFYPDLFKDNPALKERAEQLASKTHEFSEFLVNVLGVTDVGASFAARVALHHSCHLLRELQVRTEPRRLLEAVRGIEIMPLDHADACCGFGGLFSVKYPHISGGILEDKTECIERSGADVVVANDMGCLMQIGGGLSRNRIPIKTMHIAEVLDSGIR